MMLAGKLQLLHLAIPITVALLNVYAVHAAPKSDTVLSSWQSAPTVARANSNSPRPTTASQSTLPSGSSTYAQPSLALLDSLINAIALAKSPGLSTPSTMPNDTSTGIPDPTLLDSFIGEIAFAKSPPVSSSTSIPDSMITSSQVLSPQSSSEPSQIPSLARRTSGKASADTISEVTSGSSHTKTSRGSFSLSRSNNATGSPSSLSGGGILLLAQSGGATLAIPTGQAISTITTTPPGMSIETITSTTCSTLGAMITTTAAGSTTTEVVPELCINGFAFLLFGWTKISFQFCKSRLSLLGFLLQFLCDSHPDGKPIGVEILEAPKTPPNQPPGSPGDPDQDASNRGSAPSASNRPARSTITYTPSHTSTFSSSSESCSGSATVSGACCTSSTVITIPSTGASTICDMVVNTLIDEMKAIGTSFPTLPPSASQLPIPANPTTLVAASLDGFFSSLATQMFSYIDNAHLTAFPMTNQTKTSASINSTCVLTSFSTTRYCTCGTLMAGFSTTIIAPGTTSSWCPTFAVPIAPITPVMASPVRPTPTSSLPVTTTSPSCTQVFFIFPNDPDPNSFVCQCSDGTWNHRAAQESYSDCPNQIASTTLNALLPQATAPTNGVTCTLIIFAPGSPTWGPPFCECSQNLLFLGSCPASLSATATTTLTLSEPSTIRTAALPTFTTDLTAPICTEAPSLSIKCVLPPAPKRRV